MTFKEWIEQFKEDNTPIGDLARDIAEDGTFPITEEYDVIFDYLEDLNACDSAMDVFENAYEMYKNR